MGDWLIGILCSGTIAFLAFCKQSLSVSGAIAALIVGTILYAMGSLPWFGSMIFFFVSSSLVTKWKHATKAPAEAGYEKSGRRDAGQVVANGGLSVLLCIAHVVTNEPWWVFLFAGVIATVTADTWATEIGGLSRQKPISILTGKGVEPGTSGGISLPGLLASVIGGAMMGGLIWLLARISGDQPITDAGGVWTWLFSGVIGGLFGSLSDSVLGASIQRKNRCLVCGKEMEASSHCGQATTQAKGLAWLTNDWVNLISSAVGGVITLLLFLWWTY
jgi:uncharacterized protein (TIGR00297 family)